MRDTANHLTWSCHPSQREPRDAMLVVADEPLRAQLVRDAKAHGFDPIVRVTPLDAILALLAHAGRVTHAVISSQQPWGLALRELLADEFPDVRPVMLVA